MSDDMYYDDGYEAVVKKAEESDTPKVRAYKLSNGDVFTTRGLMLEFEDNILYEVEEFGTDFFKEYVRTGKSFTPEEINQMFK